MSVAQAANVLLRKKTVAELQKGGVWMAYKVLCEERNLMANSASHLAPRAWTEVVTKH